MTDNERAYAKNIIEIADRFVLIFEDSGGRGIQYSGDDITEEREWVQNMIEENMNEEPRPTPTAH